MLIGVLGLQGDVSEHVDTLAGIRGVSVSRVKTAPEIKKLDGLVIPGGESTTLGNLLVKYGIHKALKNEAVPIFGTCAGAILLAKEVNTKQFSLGFVDVKIERNAYGRQRESFETEIPIPAVGKKTFKAVFIRAPIIKKVGKGVDVLAEFEGNPVLVKQGKFLVSTFHPELTKDTRLHEYFLELVESF